MIKRQTVLVLGAGASAPYGFPVGASLVDEIVAGTGDQRLQLYRDLLDAGFQASDIDPFNRHLDYARPPSIDAFLVAQKARNPHWSQIGKFAIVAKLMPRETEDGFRKARADEDWVHYLTSRVLYGASVEQFQENRFSAVTFNFDRSFEFALFNWLRHAYALREEEAGYVARGVRVVHVNGQMGGCSWLDQPNPRPYQPDRGADYFKKFADGLKIIGDTIDPAAEALVANLFNAAEVICFLGFGYHKTNMAWLQARGLGRPPVTMEGTCLHMTLAETLPAQRAQIQMVDSSWDAVQFLRKQRVFHE